jgi:hypothetical protein
LKLLSSSSSRPKRNTTQRMKTPRSSLLMNGLSLG